MPEPDVGPGGQHLITLIAGEQRPHSKGPLCLSGPQNTHRLGGNGQGAGVTAEPGSWCPALVLNAYTGFVFQESGQVWPAGLLPGAR
jgi:hypothetical protein